MRYLFIILFICISHCIHAQKTYTNPVVNNSASQADVTVYNPSKGNYYLFSTHVMGKGVLYHSSNLTQWEATKIVMYEEHTQQQIKDMAAKVRDRYPFCLWAPHILKVGNKWNMYTSIENWGGIIVLQSDSPTGPFHFVGEPYAMVTPEDMGWEYDAIDPCVVQDDDGTWYMFFGSAFGIYRAKLTSDGLHVAPDNKFVHVAGPTDPQQKIDGARHGGMEGVYVFKHKKWWYLLCSKRIDYSIYAGRSRTLTGEYIDEEGRRMTDGYGTRMNYPTKEFRHTGHNGEIYKDRTKHWYIFYHSLTEDIPGNKYGHQQPVLSEMLWDKHGFPYVKERKTEKHGNRSPRL